MKTNRELMKFVTVSTIIALNVLLESQLFMNATMDLVWII